MPASVPPVPAAEGSPISCHACAEPLSPWPLWRARRPLAACGGSDDDASDCAPVVDELTVLAQDDLKFDADATRPTPGASRSPTNDGDDRPHAAHQAGARTGFKLSVGDTDTGTVELPAGSYVLYCDIAGHEAAGMVADLVVG
jgi:plastocyanin